MSSIITRCELCWTRLDVSSVDLSLFDVVSSIVQGYVIKSEQHYRVNLNSNILNLCFWPFLFFLQPNYATRTS